MGADSFPIHNRFPGRWSRFELMLLFSLYRGQRIWWPLPPAHRNFNSRPPEERRPGRPRPSSGPWYFNPRLPGGRRHRGHQVGHRRRDISIHASRVGGDGPPVSCPWSWLDFNPRLPGGRRPNIFQRNTLSSEISIHASRVGGDRRPQALRWPWTGISIHASRVGGDLKNTMLNNIEPNNFNPRLPGGRRPNHTESNNKSPEISIHASRVGGDDKASQSDREKQNFNPRLPGGRRLRHPFRGSVRTSISIHASRVGGDSATPSRTTASPYFNPRLPGGRRHPSRPPRTGGQYFNPRLPGGRRPQDHINHETSNEFQSTPPGWEATPTPGVVKLYVLIFQSTPPGWEATWTSWKSI